MGSTLPLGDAGILCQVVAEGSLQRPTSPFYPEKIVQLLARLIQPFLTSVSAAMNCRQSEFKLGAGFARNPIYAPAELASVERGSSPAITRNLHLATIAACPHGAVIPLIIAPRRQAPPWRKFLPDVFSGHDHRSMGTSPIVAEIPSFITARDCNL